MDNVITPEMNAAMTRTITREEVKEAVYQMGPLKAPGSDGFPGLFYQKYWSIVSEMCSRQLRGFLKKASF